MKQLLKPKSSHRIQKRYFDGRIFKGKGKKEAFNTTRGRNNTKEVVNVQTSSSNASTPNQAQKKVQNDQQAKMDDLKRRKNTKYPFDGDVEAIFDALVGNNNIDLPPVKRSEQVGQVNDPNYFKFHRFVSYPWKDCFIFKEKVNHIWKNGLITFDQTYDAKSVNMVSFNQFAPIPVGEPSPLNVEFRVINKIQKGNNLIPVKTNIGEEMWVYPDLLIDENWEIVRKKPLSHERKKASKQAHPNA